MKALSVISFCLLTLVHLKGQVNLILTGTQPYPVVATNYLEEVDFITISIMNNSTNDISLKPYANITGPKGLVFNSGEPNCSIEINSGQALRFDKNNFEDFCLNFNLNINAILNQSQLSQEEKQALLLNKILPEGIYEYCIILKNTDTNEEVVKTCIDIPINYPDRPVISMPFHESTIDGNQTQQLNITWTHIVNDMKLREGLTYNVKMIWLGRISDNNFQFPTVDEATLVFDDPNTIPFFEETDIPFPRFFSTSSLQDNQFFVDGHYFAIRVTAVNEDYPYPPQSSQSNIHIFRYSEDIEDCGESFEALPVYPIHEMTVPFTSFSNVIKMNPYCDGYRRLDYNLTVKDNATGIPFQPYTRHISWQDGPRVFYEEYSKSSDPNGFYSSHISLTKHGNAPLYERGKSYYWQTSGTMRYNNITMPFTLDDVSYEIGMPIMVATGPESGDTIGPGLVTLYAVHDQIPSNPLPPFKVMQIIDDKTVAYDTMKLQERAVLQVSKFRNFSEVIHVATHYINTTDLNQRYFDEDSRTYNSGAFISDIYAPINSEVTLSENGNYYWRLGWMKQPQSSIAEEELKLISQDDMYHIMVDSFVIGENSSENTSPVVNNNNNNACSSPCQLPEVVNRQNTTDNISGGTLTIGKFEMEVDEINKTGITYNGTGTIKIPFIKNIELEVTFSNIKINTDRVIYEGNVLGKQGGNELESLFSYISGQSIELPFGLDTTINDVHITLAYMDISFSPTNAFAEVNFNTEDILSLLYPSELYPILSTQICFSPEGFENDLIFHTIDNLVIQPNESGYGFELKGGANLNDTTSMTYFRFDCKGFHSMQLSGAVVMSSDDFLKDSGLTSNDTPINEAVRGEFKAKFVKTNMDLMITATMQDFQFADHLKGWGFDVDTFYIDISDKLNPPNFVVPQGYNQSYFNNPNTMYTWKGLYMPKIKVLTPKDFVNPNRSTFGVSTMIMGDGIYYLRHRAFNIVNEGIIGRFGATVDTVDAVISNVDFRFSLAGKINLPYTRDNAFLGYSGMYNALSDWNFIIKVPTDSLEVDIWKAYMRLYENSYFNIRSDESNNHLYVKAIVNGHISIDDSLIPANARKGVKNLKLPAIRFENLGYESGEGIIGGAVFSKASPAKFVNGFPIQLDSIALVTHQGNPGLYIEPRITLSGDENGFSGSVGMIFFAEFNNSSSKDFFDGFDMFLSEIKIDAAFASCTFKGYLKFIETIEESGFEGAIDATFPAGVAGKFKAKFINHTSDPSAPYNTAQNYNAWYVDALIGFGGNGIPLFSGVNLYGIGGGIWYNMKQDPSFKINPAALYDEQPTNQEQPPSNSPIPYSADFGSGVGLKFQGLFGDATGGDKFNMLLALKAQFPASGGPIISLRGDVNIMSKIQDMGVDGKASETTKSLWGFAEITYNGQEDFIHAQVVAKAKITIDHKIILEGKLPGYTVVDAEFHANTAGDNYWFLYVGKPDARGGIKLSAGPMSLEADSYFMMGQGIPSITPEPHPAFTAMMQNLREGYSSSGGSYVSALRKTYDFQNNASGIAFGGAILKEMNFDYQPFYLDVSLIMGMDVNFSKDSTRVCAETGGHPGHNDWYATGQLYAGISGKFGIHIDLWFLEADKELFTGSIAALMKGGLPNPSWMKCRGNLQYEIVGLIRGSHAFEMQIGDQCTIGPGNPFGDMEVITDINPANQSSNVPFLTNPTVAYALPINETIALWDDKLGKEVKYKLRIASNSLKTKDGSINYAPTVNIQNEGFTSVMVPNRYLEGKKWHTFTVTVKAKKQIGTEPEQDVRNIDGSIWSESKTSLFKTGPKPDSLLPEQIELTYPLLGQQYFLKGETENDKGFMYLTNSDPELFFTENEVTGKQYKYRLNFRPTAGGDILSEDVTVLNHRELQFKVNQLQNNTKYIGELERVLDITNPLFANLPSNANNMAIASTTTYSHQSKGNSYDIMPAKMIKLGNANQGDTSLRVLYKFIFKTSLFNTFTQKIQNCDWQGPTLQSSASPNVIFNVKNHQEDFDVYDINGFNRINKDNAAISGFSLVKAGVHFQHGLEHFGDNDFEYLNNDKIIEMTETSICLPCKRFDNWRNALPNGSLKTQVNNGLSGLEGFKYTMPLTDPDMVYYSYNNTRGVLELPIPSNNGMMISFPTEYYLSGTSPATSPPADNLTIKVRYGTNGNQMNLFNIVNLINYKEAIGELIRVNNVSLYNQITNFINYPPRFVLEPCRDTKVGLVYKTPTVSSYLIKSRKTKNYKTPGSCELPDID